jgi:uncharacterized protein
MLVDIKPIARAAGASLPVDLSGTPEAVGLNDAGYRFPGPVTFAGTVSNTGDGLLVLTGTAAASYEGDCGRCLRPVRGNLSATVAETYRSRHAVDADRKAKAGTVEDDDGMGVRFEGWTIDITGAVREALALGLPSRVLCREDCKGICPVCFADRNERDCGHEGSDAGESAFEGLKELL